MAVKRPAQRRRTRKAIVDAAMALVARGERPSVNDVARAADVSRRTIYVHFPTFDQLLLDATIGALTQTSVDRQIDESTLDDDADGRVERMVRALHVVTPDVERLGRALIRLTVDAPPSRGPGSGVARRGYRRLAWIESALAPCRKQLGARRYRRLVAALAMVVGWEALIVQRDVCGLTPAEGEELSVWAARALLRESLVPPRASGRSRRGRSGR